MSEHVAHLLRSIATGIAFVGVFGFAIDASKWRLLVLLIIISWALVRVSNMKGK